MGRGENDPPRSLSTHAGGVLGGISTGQDVVVRMAFKPTSSVRIPMRTVDAAGEETEISTKGRHDPCVGIRGAPVAEAMMALVLADQKLLHRAQRGKSRGAPPTRSESRWAWARAPIPSISGLVWSTAPVTGSSR